MDSRRGYYLTPKPPSGSVLDGLPSCVSIHTEFSLSNNMAVQVIYAYTYKGHPSYATNSQDSCYYGSRKCTKLGNVAANPISSKT
jgi:hypothetical protein